jgi:hypothetical protein
VPIDIEVVVILVIVVGVVFVVGVVVVVFVVVVGSVVFFLTAEVASSAARAFSPTESIKLTSGGVTTANRPHCTRKARLSAADRSSFALM